MTITIEEARSLKRGDIIEVEKEGLSPSFCQEHKTAFIQVFAVYENHIYVIGKNYGLSAMLPIYSESGKLNNIYKEINEKCASGKEYWYFRILNNGFNFSTNTVQEIQSPDLQYIVRIVKRAEDRVSAISAKEHSEQDRMKKFFFKDLDEEYIAPKDSPFKYL